MFGCVLSQLKPSEVYILSCEKGLDPFHSSECRVPLALSYTQSSQNVHFFSNVTHSTGNLQSLPG